MKLKIFPASILAALTLLSTTPSKAVQEPMRDLCMELMVLTREMVSNGEITQRKADELNRKCVELL